MIMPPNTRPALVINAWQPAPLQVEPWIREMYPETEKINLPGTGRSVGGRPAYSWEAQDGGQRVLMVVFQSGDRIFQLALNTEQQNYAELYDVIQSIELLDKKASQAPFGLGYIFPQPSLATSNADDVHPNAQTCSTCGETDASTNPYPCCSSYGNCTWKAEERRAGANSFVFGGSGRDAYRWMELKYQYSPDNAQGGNIPTAGAVAVFSTTFGSLGHVATVKAINSDGSIVVTEQNCNLTCTRDNTYSYDTHLKKLAGYIYNGSTAPNPSYKTVSSTIGTEVIVDDRPSGTRYYFRAQGPGSYESGYNGNYRAWRRDLSDSS